jgi:hypothetical protein
MIPSTEDSELRGVSAPAAVKTGESAATRLREKAIRMDMGYEGVERR